MLASEPDAITLTSLRKRGRTGLDLGFEIQAACRG